MTPDRFATTLARITEVVETLRRLEVPTGYVHSLSVQHWSLGTVVEVHIEGATPESVELVDRVADHYGLPADGARSKNYTRGESLGATPVLIYCGRPDDDTAS